MRVTLGWGTDEETGKKWLHVTDNGVGMTKEVIKNYLHGSARATTAARISTRNEPP